MSGIETPANEYPALADWVPCERPDLSNDQFIHLLELTCLDAGDNEYLMNVYIHRSGQFAISEVPIGGGWDYSMARIERRVLTYDRREADPDNPVEFDDRRIERRDPEADWIQFVKTYGNGEAT